MSRHHKNKALLCFAVYIFIVCLLQVACEPNRAVDDPERNLIDPDKFRLDLNDLKKERNLVGVSITPGSSGMMLGEFFVTVSLEDNEGIVRGSSGRNTKGFVYDSPLDKQCLEKLFLTNQQSNCLGKDDTSFGQGKKVSFRIKAIPNTSIKRGDQYTLTVKVEREGSNPHTETKSTVLIAKNGGLGTKEKTKKESTSGTSTQATSTALDAVPDNATQPTSQPAPNEASLITTEEATTTKASPQPVSDTNLPAMPNSEVQQPISPSSTACTSNHPSSRSLTKSSQQPASKRFTVSLQDKTQRNHVSNFVLVTVQPNSSGIKLQELAITAHVGNSLGVVRGSSDKNSGSFVYGEVLNHCNLGKIFLTNKQSNCLGENDACFAQGEEVAFRIEVKPGATVRPGDQYMLTVEVVYTGSNPHTVRQSIGLTATQVSPSKGRKRTSPRK